MCGAKYAKTAKMSKKLLFHSHTCEKKNKRNVMMFIKLSTKTLKFMTPISGVQTLERDNICPHSKDVSHIRQSSSLLSYIYLRSSGVHGTLYQSCEIHCP